MILLAGMEVQDVLEELQDPGRVNADTDDDYKVCLQKLNVNFGACAVPAPSRLTTCACTRLQSQIPVSNTNVTTDFIVLKTGRCLLSYSTAWNPSCGSRNNTGHWKK